MSEIVVGRVSAIRRYPLKSMLGEELETVALDQRGVVGDRRYALVDDETGKVVSVKRPRRWGRMFELTGRTSDDGAVVSFPDGEAVAVGDPKLSLRLEEFFGRPVSVADTPPPDARFEEVWVRELKGGAEPYFGMESRLEDGEEMIDGGAFMGPQGNFFNFGAVHLVTSGSLRELARHAPQSRFDAHRFRPNLVVDTDDDGFVETGWQGCTLQVGSVRLRVSITVPRCVMTTLPQGDLPADRDVLRTIAERNSVDVLQTGTPYPCVGVYADVLVNGEIRRGDPVRLIGAG
jgi:MOSC domain-containing protein